MRRSLAWFAASTTAILGAGFGAVLGVPVPAAAANEPIFSVPGTAYSYQPRPFTVKVKNNLTGGKVIASLSSGTVDAEMGCSGNGTGTWTCSLAGNQILSPGTVRVHAQSVDDTSPARNTDVVTQSGTISSSLSASGTETMAGKPFAVSGQYDHIIGVNDYRVAARVTNAGKVVRGQGNVPCTTDPSTGTYRCALKSELAVGDVASRYTVTVTEVSALTRDRRSVTASVSVLPIAPPSTPRIVGPTSVTGTEPITVTGEAGAPGLRVEVTVDSADFATPAAVCTTGNDRTWSCALPTAYGEGTHVVRARVIDPALADNPSSADTLTFVVSATPTATPTATPVPTPTPSPTATAATSPTSTPTAEPTPPATGPVEEEARSGARLPGALDALIALLVLGLAIITMVRPGTVSLAPDGDTGALTVDEEARGEPVGPGDRLPLWAAPGRESTDQWSRTAPLVVSANSPFLGRLLLDGSDVRAVFGSLWWLLPAGGLTLGLALGAQGEVPPVALVIGILVLGIADAAAGFLASLGYGAMLLVGGNVGVEAALLISLGLGVVWIAPSLVGNAVRPFRRLGPMSGRFAWDRFADVVVAGVLAGWLTLLVARSMDALAGVETGLAGQANLVGLVTFVAIAVRIGLAHIADLWFPERRRLTDLAVDLPEPTPLALHVGTAIRTVVFALAGHAFLGTCWQWLVGVVLLVVPDVALAIRDSAFAERAGIQLELPRGLTSVLLVVLTSTLAVVAAVAGTGSDTAGLRMAFVAAALVPALFSLVKVVTDEAEPAVSTWPLQVAGVGVVAASVFLALHGVDF